MLRGGEALCAHVASRVPLHSRGAPITNDELRGICTIPQPAGCGVPAQLRCVNEGVGASTDATSGGTSISTAGTSTVPPRYPHPGSCGYSQPHTTATHTTTAPRCNAAAFTVAKLRQHRAARPRAPHRSTRAPHDTPPWPRAASSSRRSSQRGASERAAPRKPYRTAQREQPNADHHLRDEHRAGASKRRCVASGLRRIRSARHS